MKKFAMISLLLFVSFVLLGRSPRIIHAAYPAEFVSLAAYAGAIPPLREIRDQTYNGCTSEQKVGPTPPYFTAWRGNYDYGCEGTGRHPGIDISTDMRDPGPEVRSMAAGKVFMKINDGTPDMENWGNMVIIENVAFPDVGARSYAIYAHLADFVNTPDALQIGAMVLRGSPIGHVGQTGLSPDGPHLHFQVDKATASDHPYWPNPRDANIPDDGQVVNNTFNPMPFIYAHGVHTLLGPVNNPAPGAGHYVYLNPNAPSPGPGPDWVTYAQYQSYMGYRPDAEIDFEWGYGPPWPGAAWDYFGAFWEGQVCGINDGNPHLLMLTTDDGAAVWLYGNLLLYTPYPQPPTTYGYVINWPIQYDQYGQRVECYTLWMRWYDHGGHAVAQLSWG